MYVKETLWRKDKRYLRKKVDWQSVDLTLLYRCRNSAGGAQFLELRSLQMMLDVSHRSLLFQWEEEGENLSLRSTAIYKPWARGSFMTHAVLVEDSERNRWDAPVFFFLPSPCAALFHLSFPHHWFTASDPCCCCFVENRQQSVCEVKPVG